MPWLTSYRTSERRGCLLEGLRGCLVHDHLKSYFKIPEVRHALCNAHHLRELQVLAEFDGDAWAGPLQQLLRAGLGGIRAPVRRVYDPGLYVRKVLLRAIPGPASETPSRSCDLARRASGQAPCRVRPSLRAKPSRTRGDASGIEQGIALSSTFRPTSQYPLKSLLRQTSRRLGPLWLATGRSGV